MIENGKHAENATKAMMETPITDLSRLIGAKWFLPLEELSKKSGVAMRWITQAVRGGKIHPNIEKKIREVLE